MSGKRGEMDLSGVIYPFTAYEISERLKQETVWIRNATVWTCEDEGVLENADVLMHEGVLVAIGANLQPSEWLPAEATPIEIGWTGQTRHPWSD